MKKKMESAFAHQATTKKKLFKPNLEWMKMKCTKMERNKMKEIKKKTKQNNNTKKENLPIQSGSNDPASDSEYLLPGIREREDEFVWIKFDFWLYCVTYDEIV